MSKDRIRHLSARKGAGGRLRYVWQPGPLDRRQGWKAKSLGYDKAAAIAEAMDLNAKLDAWRKGETDPKDAPAVPLASPKAARHPGTLAAGIAAYRASQFYPENPKTRTSYEKNLRILERWAGDRQMTQISKPDVQRLLAAYRDKTHTGKAIVGMLRIVYNACQLLGVVSEGINPAAKARVKTPKPRQAIWPAETIEGFVAAADAIGRASIGTAILISAEAAQRREDCMTIRRRVYAHQLLDFTQSKRHRPVQVPATRRLRERLDLVAADLEADAPLVVNERTGEAYNEDSFGAAFGEVRAAARERGHTSEGLQFRDLRRTGVVNIALAQLEVNGYIDFAAIAAVAGWTYKSAVDMLGVYLPVMAPFAAAGIKAVEEARSRLEGDRTQPQLFTIDRERLRAN